jgi:hypothetical protein
VSYRQHEAERGASYLAREQLTCENKKHIDCEAHQHPCAYIEHELRYVEVDIAAEQNRSQVKPAAEENTTAQCQPLADPSNL